MNHIARRFPSDQPPVVTLSSPDSRAAAWDDTLDVRRVVSLLLRHKRQILLVALLVLVPAALATWLTTPLYRSWALIQVNPDQVQVLPYRDIGDISVGGANFENYMGTQEQILRGAGLRARVAQRLTAEHEGQPAALEAEKLSDRYNVKKIEKSQLFEISYLAPSPAVAATVANLFAEEYLKQNSEIRQATRIKAERELKKELEALESRLQLSEKQLMDYAKANDIMSLDQGQVDPLQERLAFLSRDVAEAQSRLAAARSSLAGVESATVADFPQRLTTLELGQIESRLLQLEQEIASMRSRFGENWPALVEKRNELALVREQLTRERRAVLGRHIQQARVDVDAAEARYRMAGNAFAEQKGLINQFHSASIQYKILKREVETNRNLYDGLLERLRQTGVMASFQFGNLQVVEPARPIGRVESPKVVWNLGLALLLGLSLGICLVILRDYWHDSISTPEEADEFLPVPRLGSVPLIDGSDLLDSGAGEPRRKGRWLPTGRAARAALPAGADGWPFEGQESIRAICASILLSRSDKRARVIVVTSAMHEEGKTTIVRQLGKAFADTGVKTLLVEADLRKPDLSRGFNIDHRDGLSLYLAGHVSPGPRIHDTGTPNLYLAAAGPKPPNAAALLHSDRLNEFLKKAAETYELVIIDAPPLLAVADARILGREAEGTVLVVRAGRTSRSLVRRAWTLLDHSGANVLGMVLNGWQPSRAERSQYAYYGAETASDAEAS